MKSVYQHLTERSSPVAKRELIADPDLVEQLVLSSGRNNIIRVQDLLNAGVDPNAKNSWGEVALSRSLTNSDAIEVSKLLLNYGAQASLIQHKTIKFMTKEAFDLVKSELNEEDVFNAVSNNIRDNDYGSIVFKLDNIKKQDYLDSLLYDAFIYCPSCVDKLLKRKANIDALNEYSSITPLMRATKNNDLETVKKLLELGAQTDVVGKYRKTAMDYVSTLHNQETAQKIKELLLQYS